MSLSVDAFKSTLIADGARPNLFQVILNAPGPGTTINSQKVSFLIKGASLPASTIASIPVPFRGREIKVAGDRTFEDWTVTVINDNNMTIRNTIESWMNAINGNQNNVGTTGQKDKYLADLEVHQLDKTGASVKSYKFIGAFPTNCSSIDLNYGNTNQIEEFQVTFAYQYWISNTTSGGGLIQKILGAIGL